MFLSRIKREMRLTAVRKQFYKNAKTDPSTVFQVSASCRNGGAHSNITIASHCTIAAEFIACFGGRISVGENTYIGPGTSIQAKENVSIGNNVIIANNVVLVDNNNHPVEPEKRLEMSACEDFMRDEKWTWKDAVSAPIRIEDNVWIGRDARVLKGVTIGKGSVVALGAIVTKDVPPKAVMGGVPENVIRIEE